MGEVALELTPLSAVDAEASFRAVGVERADVLRLLLALWDLETAGGRQMHNWNFGNLVATSAEAPFFVGSDSGNIRRFQAFDGPASGAAALVSQLTRDTRQQWHAGLLTGDPHLFVRALSGREGGPAYFEAAPERYLRGFLSRWETYGHLASATPSRARNTGSGALFFSSRPQEAHG